MSRVTSVPAQITTVEDKIVGSLNMLQIILLGTALLGSGGVFLWLEPMNKITLLKIILLVVMDTLLCGSALRVKGELLVSWVILLVQYFLRPRMWVYDKNSAYLRVLLTAEKSVIRKTEVKHKVTSYKPIKNLSTPKLVQIERLMNNPSANVRFVNTKGGLQIVFKTEAKQKV